ncbi:MAG: hypothetical protein IPK68_18420 [Bdellovibrionales bacterium]|nr:hypothetical protein [Bdellovibrionales bacterium]
MKNLRTTIGQLYKALLYALIQRQSQSIVEQVKVLKQKQISPLEICRENEILEKMKKLVSIHSSQFERSDVPRHRGDLKIQICSTFYPSTPIELTGKQARI